MLNVIMLNVIMLNVIVLSVVVPLCHLVLLLVLELEKPINGC